MTRIAARILDRFKFRNQIDTMVDSDIPGAAIEKFTSSDINLSPYPIYKDEEKKDRKGKQDNLLKNSGGVSQWTIFRSRRVMMKSTGTKWKHTDTNRSLPGCQ